jgi:hypothetical protein
MGSYFSPCFYLQLRWVGGFREDINNSRHLGELLEKVYSINPINFNLGTILKKLLEMLSSNARPTKKIVHRRKYLSRVPA